MKKTSLCSRTWCSALALLVLVGCNSSTTNSTATNKAASGKSASRRSQKTLRKKPRITVPQDAYADVTAALDAAAKAREQGDNRVQQRAETWLQQQGTGILPALATVLHDPQADIARRITACRVLAALGKAARGELLKAIASKERLLKIAATERISLIQPADKATVQALIQLLEDPDTACRRIAIQSLRRIGTQARSAIPPLAAIANESEDESIRGEAVKALKEIDPRHTLSGLRE
ncbi:MAG: HEAT repeat domain-containing protein [Pirellulaceae bacterium]|jgi:hypothetical protein|nr:HEAT repeat domain-containing protein [Pirellulaceae bacterium]